MAELKPCPFCGGKDPCVCTYAECEGHEPGHPDYETTSNRYVVVCDFTADGCGAVSGVRESVEEAVEAWNRRASETDKVVMEEDIDAAPTLDVEPVRGGKWALETHSFYRDSFDESVELCVYITAHCKDCGCKHPNNCEVYSVTLNAPEYADDDFRFDRATEEEKVLARFSTNGYRFANYCPNCGAKMEVE